VRVRLFAALREMAGTSWLEDQRAPDVDALLRSLGGRFGIEFERVARAGTAVVNGEPAPIDAPLGPDDEVTLLPPVSGGV
jgi:molybdopterin converting factor small subunit